MTGKPGKDDLKWHEGQVSPDQRAAVLGHQAACLWLTGLSGAGKSTLARAVEATLVARGVHAYVLDGDNLRMGLNRDLGFSPADRSENIRRVAEVSRLLVDSGAIVLCAFISPFRRDRDHARQLMGECFAEVFLNPGLDECERRDPKGLYARARRGDLDEFTGISSPYEAPTAPELELDTGAMTLDESTAAVLNWLEAKGLVDAETGA